MNDAVAPAHTNISAPAGCVACKRNIIIIISSGRKTDRHHTLGDWTAAFDLQQSNITVPQRLPSDVVLVDDDLTHAETLLFIVEFEAIKLANHHAVVARVPVTVANTAINCNFIDSLRGGALYNASTSEIVN